MRTTHILPLLGIITSTWLLAACSTAADVVHSKMTNRADSALVQPYKTGMVTPVDYTYTPKETFSLISWNVEHFLDPFDDPYIENDREDASAESMGNRLTYFIDALKQANADIVVLQEFESAKFLRKLADEHFADMGYLYFADAPSHTWYMNVVIMSRFPLGIMYSYGNVTTPVVDWLDEEGKPESQNRLNTRAWSIDVYPSEDYNFLLTVLHLKAGRGERNESMRLGQIEFLRGQFDRFVAEDPDRNILVVGDFNALPDSREMKALLGDPTQTNGFTDPLAPEQFTHTAIEPLRRLDYIIYNKNMAPEVLMDSIKPVYYFAPEKQDEVADHLPVVGEFYIGDR